MMAIASHPAPHNVGWPCVDGDWAWVHGDFGALRDIAQRLAASAPEPMHCELMKLAELCLYDLDGAAALWTRLKDQLYQLPRS
jgi:hypothetical protein